MVADAVIEQNEYDYEQLHYDNKTKEITYTKNPADYDHVILLSPVWAFALAEPMKQYIATHAADIKGYDLIVTCGVWGLRGCVKNCLSAIGRPPNNALIFRAKDVRRGAYDIRAVTYLWNLGQTP